MTDNATERANLLNVRNWETERKLRIDGYAAVLTHLNAAREALPGGDPSRDAFAGELAIAAGEARGRMRAIFQETNPFVGER